MLVGDFFAQGRVVALISLTAALAGAVVGYKMKGTCPNRAPTGAGSGVTLTRGV